MKPGPAAKPQPLTNLRNIYRHPIALTAGMALILSSFPEVTVTPFLNQIYTLFPELVSYTGGALTQAAIVVLESFVSYLVIAEGKDLVSQARKASHLEKQYTALLKKYNDLAKVSAQELENLKNELAELEDQANNVIAQEEKLKAQEEKLKAQEEEIAKRMEQLTLKQDTLLEKEKEQAAKAATVAKTQAEKQKVLDEKENALSEQQKALKAKIESMQTQTTRPQQFEPPTEKNNGELESSQDSDEEQDLNPDPTETYNALLQPHVYDDNMDLSQDSPPTYTPNLDRTVSETPKVSPSEDQEVLKTPTRSRSPSPTRSPNIIH